MGCLSRASSRERQLLAGQTVELGGGGGYGGVGGFGAEAELLGADEGDVVDADDAEHRAQMRLLAVHECGRALAVEAAAGLDDDRLRVLDQALGAGRGVTEGDAGAQDMV